MSKPEKFADIDKAIGKVLLEAKTFEERCKAIEIAMKFEALKLKSMGDGWGKGFEPEEGEQ